MEASIAAYNADSNSNLLFGSDIPESCRSSPCSLGIDEAGRGPVLGPMVYACAFCPEEKHETELKALGVDDSKALTEQQREKLHEKLVVEAGDYVGYKVHVLAPNFISRSMHRRGKYNLNAMSHDTAANLVRKALDDGVKVASVFVDTVGPPEKYQAKLEAIFPELKITVAKKADSLYPCVSAASICAKVARDAALKNWTFQEGADLFTSKWGSGYPGDPATKKFLRENLNPVFGFPSLVRFSWKTAEKILEERCVNVAFEEVEPEDEEHVKKNPSVKNYFIKAPSKFTAKAKNRRHPYFTERGLSTTDFF